MTGNFPEELRYTQSDEWVRREGEHVTVGITAFATEQLGDTVDVQLPSAGTQCYAGSPFGEIESVKAASDLLSPLTGEVSGTNSELEANPGLINEDPYGRGWLIKLQVTNSTEYDSLLDASTYEKNTAERH
ncbi:MAG: glycine cleavage system protein GcvH [Chloroflexota bacterium]